MSNIVVAEKINYLINYIERQFSESKGLRLNSNDWKVYIHVRTPEIYKFVINGVITFHTDSYISGKTYTQYIKLTDYKKLEAPLLLLFLVGVTEQEIIDYIVEFFSRTEVKMYCNDPSFCLTGDTLIPLIDGSVKTMKMLYDDYNVDNENWVYSSTGKKESWGKIKRVWISGKSNVLTKIILSNDKEILTTPEHYYITDNNIPIMANDLEIGQKLLSNKDIYVKDIQTVILDSLIDVYDMEIDNEYHNFMTNAGVFIHNSYWGTAYNLTQINSIYGPVELRPPDIRDPKRNQFACKHLWLVLENYKTNIQPLVKSLIPYYKRLFGIQSPQGIERLKRNMGVKGFQQIVEQSIKNLINIKDDVLYNKFDELTRNKLNTILNPVNLMEKTENKDVEQAVKDNKQDLIDEPTEEMPDNNTNTQPSYIA